MLQEIRKKIVLVATCSLSILSIGALLTVNGAYVNTNRDTRKAPKSYKSAVEVTEEYEEIYSAGHFKYYWKDENDILLIENTETGDVWKTGVDKNISNSDAKKIMKNLSEISWYQSNLDRLNSGKKAVEQDDETQIMESQPTVDDLQDSIEKCNKKIVSIIKDYGFEEEQLDEVVDMLKKQGVEMNLTGYFLDMFNSIATVEYFQLSTNSVDGTSLISTQASDESSVSSLDVVEGESNKFALHVTVKSLGVEIPEEEWSDKYIKESYYKDDNPDLAYTIYLTLSDDGKVTFDIPAEEITGPGKQLINYIELAPYLGASGGLEGHYNEDTQSFDDEQYKDLTPGYVFIPDGSGALVRYSIYNTKFTEYEGYVYGQDPSEYDYYYQQAQDAVPLEDPVMPVFGASYGDGNQTAFVAYADKGDEYMQIVCGTGSSGKTDLKYTYVYPRFQYNTDYFFVQNQAGESYRTVRDEANEFDVSITYQFLYGDGTGDTEKADYTGMALAYRQHLIDEGVLHELSDEDISDNISTRIDFLASDSKKGIIGTNQVTMTTTDDMDNILDELINEKGISNISSGVIGWQAGGENIADPDEARFSGAIGSEGDFEDLIDKYSQLGVEVSLSRDFVTINETMMGYYGNAAKHNNTQYLLNVKTDVLPSNVPIDEFGYALPTRTAEWVEDLYDDIGDFSKSMTLTGISNILVSSHNSDGSETTVTDAIKLYQDALASIKSDNADFKLDLEKPNKYLWQYTDRYLQTPVTTSQYIYETDTVPFLEMVLHGTMELYGPYCNFSFYTTDDMLKMIDYNISPSFILTEQSSYLLASTISSEYYSTEYSQYKDLIGEIYETVNAPLSQVQGYDWTGRYVLADGVIENVYEKGSDKKVIVINYTDESFDYAGTEIPALSAQVADYKEVTIPTEDDSEAIQESTIDTSAVADTDTGDADTGDSTEDATEGGAE